MPVLPDPATRVNAVDDVLGRLAVVAARMLARRSPKTITAVLSRVSAGTRPADYGTAKHARDTVLTVSTRCCGNDACLPRSIAAALLCRARGTWPVWCTGVVATPPFRAHAWIEAEGRMVDEHVDDTTYRTVCQVPVPPPQTWP
jgi:hypothetical protein